MGNWSGYVKKTSGSTDLNQTRTHNVANELTQIDSSSTHVGEDAAGNMTKVPKPSSWSAHYDLTFDARNRLVKVVDGANTVAEYEYLCPCQLAGTDFSGGHSVSAARVWSFVVGGCLFAWFSGTV